MSSDINIPPELIEKALYRFLLDQQCEDPSYIRRLMEDIEDDAACLRLAKKTDAEKHEKVPASEIFDKLRS